MFTMHHNHKSGPPERRKPSIKNCNAWRIQWALLNATEIKRGRTCVTSRLKPWTCQMQASNITLSTVDARCLVNHFWSSYTHFILTWPFQFSQQMCKLHTRHEINTRVFSNAVSTRLLSAFSMYTSLCKLSDLGLHQVNSVGLHDD